MRAVASWDRLVPGRATLGPVGLEKVELGPGELLALCARHQAGGFEHGGHSQLGVRRTPSSPRRKNRAVRLNVRNAGNKKPAGRKFRASDGCNV